MFKSFKEEKFNMISSDILSNGVNTDCRDLDIKLRVKRCVLRKNILNP